MQSAAARRGKNAASRRFVSVLLSSLAFAPALPALAQPAAATPTQAQSVEFDIAAQPLASALSEFARQSDQQILFDYERVAHLRAPALRGRYTREDALARLLAQSGLTARLGQSGQIRLENPARPQHIDAASGRGAPTEGAAPAPAADSPADTDSTEIVVTGTRIRGAEPAGSNVLTMDRAAIEEAGRSTVIDVLQTLPQVFPGSQNETTQLYTTDAGSNIAFGSTVDLRGLGSDATLTLVNGRRIAPAGFGNFVDVSAIPLAAVERVEVLADGASATYGSDAVGGVVNIVLRNHFDGAETSLRLGGATEGGLEERGFSHLQGWDWTGANLIVGYEYRAREALAAADRAFTADTDLRPLGGDNFSRNFAAPGNITRVGTSNVVFAIPGGQDGTDLQQSELLAGQVNFQNGNLGADIIPEQASHSAFGSFSWQASDRLELFADLLASHREAENHDTQLTGTLTVPQTNAYRQLNNLFPGAGNVQVAYSFHNELGPVRYQSDSDTLSTVAGAGFDLTEAWRLEGAVGYSRHTDSTLFNNAIDTTVLPALLASNSLSTAFNPFSANGNQTSSVMAQLRRSQLTENESELTTYAIKADGPLFELPGGALRLAIGAERRMEAFEIWRVRTSGLGVVTIEDAQPPGERTTDAFFAELYAPLIGAEQAVPFVHQLDLSLSVRQEHSEDYGTATTPKVGIGWSLAEDFRIRGTWGTSFKAPRFDQTLSSISGVYGVASPAQDPFATNGSTGLLQVLGGNPDLEPEDAEIWTAGFDYAPSWFDGFSAHATYFQIDFANRIALPGGLLDAIRNPTAYPNNLFRNPSPDILAFYMGLDSTIAGAPPPDGVELIFDTRLSNIASQEVRGIDISLNYDIETEFGAFAVFIAASNLLEFSQTTNPSAPAREQVNTFGKPVDWRGRLGFGWSTEAWRANATMNYVSDYTDTISIPQRSVASWTTWDAQLSRRWGDLSGGAGGVELSLSVRNLFNEDPPFVNNAIGIALDPANASPVGRTVSLELRRRW